MHYMWIYDRRIVCDLIIMADSQNSCHENDESAAKKQKLSEAESSDALNDFGGFKITKVLLKNLSSKSVFLLGTFSSQAAADRNVSADNSENPTPVAAGGDGAEDPMESGEKQAVVLLEKTAFTDDSLPSLMSSDTSLTRSMQNDIYGVYECFPPKELSGTPSWPYRTRYSPLNKVALVLVLGFAPLPLEALPSQVTLQTWQFTLTFKLCIKIAPFLYVLQIIQTHIWMKWD